MYVAVYVAVYVAGDDAEDDLEKDSAFERLRTVTAAYQFVGSYVDALHRQEHPDNWRNAGVRGRPPSEDAIRRYSATSGPNDQHPNVRGQTRQVDTSSRLILSEHVNSLSGIALSD